MSNNNQAKSLPLPPIANGNQNAVEVLRVWASPGSPSQFTIRTAWKDPGAWGLVLLDVARHVAQAYKAEGKNPDETLARIRVALDSEWNNPT